MIVERHYDDETLIALSSDPAQDRDPHLSTCASCSEALAAYRDVVEVLAEPAVWDAQELRQEVPPQAIAALRSFAKDMAAEDASAGPLLEELLQSPRESWTLVVAGDLRYQTAGVVRILINRSETIIDQMPPDAVELARAAAVIAQALDPSEYVSDTVNGLRGAANRQLGYALFYVGEHAQALETVERAQAAFELCTVSEYDLARVNIVRALIFVKQERYEPAILLARDAAHTFLAFADRRRLAAARTTEAYALMHESRYREALPILLQVERQYQTEIDSDARARVLNSIARCYWQTARIAEALQTYQEAAALYELVGTETEAARIRMNVAGLLAAEGRNSEAKRRLWDVRDELTRLGMNDAAVFAGLILSEVLLVEGDYLTVEEICRTAIDQYQRTGIAHTADALTALTYLKEAAAQRRATPAIARHIKEYFERLPKEPALLFAPPPDPLR